MTAKAERASSTMRVGVSLIASAWALAGCSSDKGDRSTVSSAPPSVSLPTYDGRFPPPAPDSRRAVAIAVGDSNSCAVLEKGSVWCWGSDARGQLGWDMPMSRNVPGRSLPTQVEGVEGATSVAIGAWQGCAIVADGAIRCWGAQGDRLDAKRVLARALPALRGAVQLALSADMGCAVVSGGAVHCWLGVAGSEIPPTLVKGLEVAELRIGRGACARLLDGTVQCGEVHSPKMALGSPFVGLHAQPGDVRAVQIGEPRDRVCAVRAAGDVVCWSNGGSSAWNTMREPEVLAGASEVAQVSGGCTLSKRGALRCQQPGQTEVVSLDGIRQFATGKHSCALDDGGDVRCWGANESGQLANGTRRDAGPAVISW